MTYRQLKTVKRMQQGVVVNIVAVAVAVAVAEAARSRGRDRGSQN